MTPLAAPERAPDADPEIFDCRTCGACCVEAGPVPVSPLDVTPRHLTRSVRETIGFSSNDAADGMRQIRKHMGGRCVALRGEIGCSVRCAIYERRPSVCATFEPGSDACRGARQDMQAKMTRMDWKPRGYGPRHLDGGWEEV